MKRLIFFPFFFASFGVFAETIKSEVYSVGDGMIKFQNGRVAFLTNSGNEKTIKRSDHLIAEVDEESNLLGFKKIDRVSLASNKNFQFEEPPLFEPSVVEGSEEANHIFNRSNPFYKRISECSDRAHVWAHDEFKKTGTKSMKAFVFFTASYINSVRFKWWFHVAPMYRVKVGDEIKELVMDFRYTDRPMTVKEWTDHFVYTKRPCKVTTKFSEYDVNPQTENCYLIFESMHYKIPGEIHDQELSGRYKTETTENEVKASRRLAFQ
jgi:hypothetical protein